MSVDNRYIKDNEYAEKINQSNVLLFIVFILIFIYTSNDLATGSTSYNFSGVSRTSSHIWLALSIIFIGLAGILLHPENILMH